MPDRLPSLIVLVGFWIPPAVAGWVAAGSLHRTTGRRPTATCAILATFVAAYAATWFLFNLGRMPPYIPGSVRDPTIATPRAVRCLAILTSVLVLPGSAFACALAFHRRGRVPRRTSHSRASG